MLALIQIALGGALLVAGRRLYWLLAAALGFVGGLFLANLLLPNEPQTSEVVIALALAGGGALLFVVFKKFLIGLIGFLAGGVAMLLLTRALTPNLLSASWMVAVVFMVGGALGASLLFQLFDLGLMVLSAIIGAYLVLTGLMSLVDFPGQFFTLALVLLIGAGIALQMRPRRRK